jgi:hypothetical protein
MSFKQHDKREVISSKVNGFTLGPHCDPAFGEVWLYFWRLVDD